MIIDVSQTINPSVLNFGTHNGIFHGDDVMGIAILEMAYMESPAHVVRTENRTILNKLPIVIDIGGGKFDHHMADFNMCRSTGEKYASAGLIWKDYAEKAIRNVAYKYGRSINDKKIQIFKEQIDEEIIIPLDLEDNGIICSNHMFRFIPKFVPTWLEIQDFDTAFKKAESIVYRLLENIIKNTINHVTPSYLEIGDIVRRINEHDIAQVEAKPYLQKNCETVNDDGILEIPAQTMPWVEYITNYNDNHNYKIKFVIFPYPRGGWAAQSIPPSINEKFKQLVSFPKEWAGRNEYDLPKISGISDAIFCHNGRFFARARTKRSIIDMCKIAMG